MNSNIKHYVGYGLAIAALLFFVRLYHEEAIGKVKAEAQAQIVSERDKIQKAASDQLAEQIKGLKTPAQAAPVIQRFFQLPKADVDGSQPSPSPLREVLGAQLPPEATAGVPDAPTAKFDVLDPSQQVALAKKLLACDKTDGELTTCELDKQNLQNEINDLKGGTKWQRMVKEVKCLGFLGAGAALGSKVGGWKGAAIGGTAGEVSCRIFF